MMERYLQLQIGRRPDAPVDRATDTLTTIWSRVLYGVAQAQPSSD
jgi:hypothetical protein